MKRIIAILLTAWLLILLAACGKENGDKIPAQTATVTAWSSETAGIWYNEAQMGEDAWVLHVGRGNETALRVGFPSDIQSLESARLWLKFKEGEVSKSLTYSLICANWNSGNLTYADMQNILIPGESVDVKEEADGWVSFDITAPAKKWVSAEIQNYGFVLVDTSGSEAVYYSSGGDGESNYPKLELNYTKYPETVTNRQGKFDFTMVGEYEGNCLAYALRDKDMILGEDLAVDYDEMNRIYGQSGEDAVADYIASITESYVEAHKDSLQISSLRRIDSYYSEINPQTEYRVVMRFGYPYHDMPLDEKNFDFHWRIQVSNGRWTQKFPLEEPGYIQCLPAGSDPAKYRWDSAWIWGIFKFQDVYASKPVYYAVTKSCDEFTTHKQ